MGKLKTPRIFIISTSPYTAQFPLEDRLPHTDWWLCQARTDLKLHTVSITRSQATSALRKEIRGTPTYLGQPTVCRW